MEENANQPENADPDGGGDHELDIDSDSDENSMMGHDILIAEGPELLEAARESSDSDDNEEEQTFDISLAASHSYMGPGLVAVSGRRVLEPGWTGRVPAAAHHGAVFPGETVPMLLPNPADSAALQAIQKERLFGLLCPDETGTVVSGYGVLCEVFECGAREARQPLTLKARAHHRFRLVHAPAHAAPVHVYSRMRFVEVRVLPEVELGEPLRAARLASLDPHRRPREPQLDRRLRCMDAAVTPWPLFVYDMFDYTRVRRDIASYFATLNLDKLPEDPVSLSFWVASNLALSARDRLALFAVDNALLRLHMELRLIARKSVLCCSACMTEIARREHIFPMSSEGVHSNYTNLGGYMHDIVTVSAASVALDGAPSAEYSWFPGYTWTIALCATCTHHVGWRFDAMKARLRPTQFFALCRNSVQPRAGDERDAAL
ncbi:protein cereblon [Ostrinia furnacalis]|uniref:protein cereblon n=1 Tax=Ostrinia furnacalis TaxID=93504 RepID=UPI00103B2550|nr:protein cereblon [Ostrinia furnacalis]